jgi:glycosyltransferase involved in cell wall biosynthesis
MNLSAIVPIKGVRKNSESLTRIINLAAEFRIHLILVLDVPDESDIALMKVLVSQRGDSQAEVHQSHASSPGGARNLGMQYIKRDWLMFWDSDDCPQVENILMALSEINSEEIPDVLIGEFALKDQVTVINPSWKSRTNLTQVLTKSPGLWRMIFRSSTVHDAFFPEIPLGEDQIFLWNYFSEFRKIGFTSRVLYSYNSNEEDSQSKKFSDIDSRITALKTLANNLENRQRITPDAYPIVINLIMSYLISVLKTRDFRGFRVLFRVIFSSIYRYRLYGFVNFIKVIKWRGFF